MLKTPHSPVSMKHLNGQFSQPKTVETILKKRWSKKKWKKKIGSGFFVEAGAFDGALLSNSLLFELKYNWTGLLGLKVQKTFLGHN